MSDSIERSKIRMEVPYFQTPNSIFDLNLELTIYQKMVYIYLCRCCNQGAEAFPSYNTIADKCGMSRRKAIDTIKQLIECNLLFKELRPLDNKENLTNIYLLNEPSAYHAPSQCTICTTLVHDSNHPSEQDAPKKELYNKKQTKKNQISITTTTSKIKGTFNNYEQRDKNNLVEGMDLKKIENKLNGWEG